jgi:hypothetical protein
MIKNIKDPKQVASSIKSIISKCEAAIEITADLTLKLKDLTKGFLPDLTTNLIKVAALVTAGNGGSGLKAGLYFTANVPNVLAQLGNLINGLINHFASVLEIFGVNKPKLSTSGSTKIGFVANSNQIGITFKDSMTSIDIQCWIRFSPSKASCNFNGNFFTMIAEAGKWAIKAAKKLFDEAKDIGLKVAQGAKALGENIKKAIVD